MEIVKLYNSKEIRIVSIFFIIILFTFNSPMLVSCEETVQYIYVSPDGSDTNEGSITSPYQTIEMARDRAAQLAQDMTGDIVVYLRGGQYYISEPLIFSDEHSGNNGYKIIYRNYPNELPVIDGGVPITGWEDEGNGIYSASVDEGMNFRQLYIDNKRGVRSREPDGNNYYTLNSWIQYSKKLKINKDEIENWNNLNHVEMVIARSYTQNRLRIASFTKDNTYAYVTPMEREREEAWFFKAPRKGPAAYFMENALEFIDEEGEWYLDRALNKVYYMPKSTEDMDTVTVIAPQTETLIDINGASDIWFYGLQFQHTNWTEPSDNGYVQRQGGLYCDSIYNYTTDSQGKNVWAAVPGAILLQNCSNILFQRNIIQHVGGNGINYDSGTHDNQIVGNVFYEISDTAILLGTDQEPYPSEEDKNKDEFISNNYFSRMGVDYSGSMAIFASFPDHVTITNNEIEYSHNLAMNVGWNNYDATNTALNGAYIANNKLHDTAMRHDDNGGIHLKNNHINGYIFENYFYKIGRDSSYPTGPGYPSGAIFLDNHTDSFLIEHNVFENNEKDFRYNQTGDANIIRNNIYDQDVINRSGITSEFLDIKGFHDNGLGIGDPYLLEVPLNPLLEPIIPGEKYELPINDTFEEDVVGDMPAEYNSEILTSGSISVADENNGENQFVQLEDSDSNHAEAVEIRKNLVEQDGTVNVTVRLKAMQKTGALFMNLLNDDSKVIRLCLGGNGTIRYWPNESFVNIIPYNADQWYTVKIVADLQQGTYDIYIDNMDEALVTDVSMSETNNTINGIQFTTGWSTGTYGVDDVEIVE